MFYLDVRIWRSTHVERRQLRALDGRHVQSLVVEVVIQLKIQRSGVNFTNVLQAAFTRANPNRVKKTVKLSSLFALLGSAPIKPACKHVDEIDPKLQYTDCKTPDTLNIFDKGFSIFDERTTKHTKEDRKNLLIRFFFHSKQSTFFEDQLFYLKLRSSICQSPRFTAGKVNNRRYTLSAFF